MKKNKIHGREPLLSRDIDLNTGLNDSQITERQHKNYINDIKIGSSKTLTSIFFGNIFTFFNMLCLLVCIWLITVIEDINDVKNLTFMVIISCNIAFGIFQEVKAKKIMDKLSLLSSPNIKALRNGSEKIIKLNQILTDDIMLLSSGNQVCSDCEICEGEVEVNESQLTGESLPIKKHEGEELLSGSFIVSGKCKAKVVHIAEENYIQNLASEAKKFKKVESELLHSLKLLMRIIGFLIFPIALLSFLTNWNEALNEIIFQSQNLFSALGNLNAYNSAQLYQAYKQAVTPTSTALIGMIPAGLFLLTSLALTVGVRRLAKKNALVQELYSIETLARVNMLCLDKTGTITDGTMKVKECIRVSKDKLDINNIISSMQVALEGNNQTALALSDYFKLDGSLIAEYTIPFSSERKCSGVKFKEEYLYLLGAPEYINVKLPKNIDEIVDEQSRLGNRCLMLAVNKSDNLEKGVLPVKSTPLAIIVIEDNVKEDAIETIAYFKANGVDVRVISGDNPITVSEVAKRVGINNADKYISLQDLSDDEVRKIALNYSVFGRVSPSQKKLLIQIFKAAGNTVAMTGDGINDILALKEANCSIAMANGSEATRNVAQLVLLDSNFSSMPRVVGEGRRVVNNIERASTLFLSKTFFSMVLQMILILMGIALPLEPIQLSFISFFAIGVPSFILALEPNDKQIQGKFINNVAKKVLPGSIAVVLNIVIIMLLCVTTEVVQIPSEMLSTVVMVAIYSVFLQILYNISKPFNRTRLTLFMVILIWSFGCILLMPLGGDSIFNLFNIVSLSNPIAVFMILALVLLSENIIKLINYFICKIRVDANNKITMDIDDLKKLFGKNSNTEK